MPQERLTRPTDNQVKFRADSQLLGEFWVRTFNTSPGLTARRDLDRYYYFVNRAVPKFSPAEAAVIITALESEPEKHVVPQAAYLTWAIVADAIRDKQLDREHGIDGDRLVDRLRELHRFEALAVVDAAERARILLARKEAGDIFAAAQRVGLA